MVGDPIDIVREDVAGGEFLVSRRAFTDKGILDAERQHIFEKCWLYVCHESEIAKNNDFITRQIGGRELLISRDNGGDVHAFFNTCPHRGAMVERESRGSKRGFRCFYHGWSFYNDGRFATRYLKGDYPADFDADGCKSLIPVPRLDHHRGLYFVCFDAAAVELANYLGDARKYIDLVLDHSPAGMAIVDGKHEYSIRANWKLLAENSVDAYHAMSTHITYIDFLRQENGFASIDEVMRRPNEAVVNDFSPIGGIDLGGGHAVVTSGPILPGQGGRPVAHWIPAWGDASREEIDARYLELVALHGQDRADVIARWNRNMIVFPNLVINDFVALTLRTFYPAAPDLVNVQAWAMAPVDESDRLRAQRLDNYLTFLGPGGFATPDDQEALEACQRGYRNVEAGWNDISRGMLREGAAKATDERQMRAFWREWDRRMRGAALA